MPEFAYQDLLPIGHDETPYRLADHRRRVHVRHPGGPLRQGRARGAHAPHPAGDARHRPPPAARAPPAAAQHPRRPRGLAQRPLRRPRPAEERQHRGRRRAADVPGHGHGHRQGQAGPVRVHRRRRRGGHRPRHLRDLPHLPPALLPDGPAHDVGGDEHRHQPAGRDQDRGRRRRRLQAALHGQGWRLGQQELPVPGDQGRPERAAACSSSSTPRSARSAPRPARRTTWPSSSAARRPRWRWRRPSWPSTRYLDTLPKSGNELGRRLPGPRAGAAGAGAHPPHGDRRPVRRQVLLPRRAGDPPAPPRRQLPDRHRRLLLGRPPGARQDHRRRGLPGAAGDRPGPVPARDDPGRPRRRGGPDRPEPPDERDPRRAVRATRSRPGSRSPAR